MSVVGHKRKSPTSILMSVKPPKAEVAHTTRDVRFVPLAEVAGVSIAGAIGTSRCRWRSRPQHQERKSFQHSITCKLSASTPEKIIWLALRNFDGARSAKPLVLNNAPHYHSEGSARGGGQSTAVCV